MWTKENNYIIQGNAETAEMDLYHLILAPTYACNLRCKHCYLPHHNPNFMSYETVEKIMDDWTNIVLRRKGRFGGIFHLKGGEPLIMPYFNDILNKVSREESLRLMITTNGTLFKPIIFDSLERCCDKLDGNVIVNLSLDGATANTHDFIRKKGSFSKSIRFLEELKDRNIPTHINFVINKKNITEAAEIIALSKKYGVIQTNFLPFVAKGLGQQFSPYEITPLEIYNAIENLYKSDKTIKDLLIGTLSDILRKENKLGCQTKECVLGYRGLYYIIPNGNVYSCPNMMHNDFKLENINDISLIEIDNTLIQNLYARLENKTDLNDYTCKGAVMYYEKVKNDRMFKESQIFNEKLNSISSTSGKRNLAFCFSRNI